jgi:site-specific DNA-methyltransferase (adenine-specific)
MQINLMKGDCLERMKEIPNKSVDMVLTDPPYGTTACKWDSIIPFDKMWAELKRIVRNEKSAVLLFGQNPFTSSLIHSNKKMWRYDYIWDKVRGTGFLNANRRPLINYEVISVFSEKPSYYFPQMVKLDKPYKFNSRTKTSLYGSVNDMEKKTYTHKHPSAILRYSKETGLHPTQKPVSMLEHLIKTYTIENETVLDFTMGSGSTGVACKNLNRNFIGIERDDKYFEIAKERINNTPEPSPINN